MNGLNEKDIMAQFKNSIIPLGVLPLGAGVALIMISWWVGAPIICLDAVLYLGDSISRMRYHGGFFMIVIEHSLCRFFFKFHKGKHSYIHVHTESMTSHIGIVACSAEGAALCYRTICVEGAVAMGTHSHPEITMHTYPLHEYMVQIEHDNWEGVGALMTSSVRKLAQVGADFAICPDNTIHQAFDIVVRESPIPWLHIAEEVAKEAKRKSFTCLGILGTKYLMEGPVYKLVENMGMQYMIPEEKERTAINDIIFNELVYGVFRSESRHYLSNVIKTLKEKGCDAVVLGCTEIPLLVIPEESPLPVLDSTRLLARAALKKAVQEY